MRKSLVLLAVLLSASAIGCGDSDEPAEKPAASSPGSAASSGASPATSDSLDGRSFEATDARGIEITASDPLTLEFDGDRVSVDAGCNSIDGRYSLTDGVLQAFLTSTLIGCPSSRAELEIFVSELLRQEAVTSLVGDELTLDGKNGNSLTLTD
ncbi:MAG: META domain-containing protein [Solirubrobacterales bacterium]